jgi:glycosyltransferase involved in cell wall biosynthesis/O-antigen/teichoic acid export membrane protein
MSATPLIPAGAERPRPLSRLLPAAATRFSRDAALMLVAVGLVNASNYAFHVVVSRLLGPGEYGELASLLAVLMLLSVPVGVVQTVVAKRAASLTDRDEVDRLAAGATRALVPFALLAAMGMLALSAPAATFLSAGAGSVALLAPYAALSLLLSALLGVLQGRMRFAALTAVTSVGVLVRLVVGAGLVWAGLGVAGAVLATVISQVATLALAAAVVAVPARTWRTARAALDPFRGETARTLTAFGAFWVLGEIDILLARHYLGAEQSGFYSSAGLVSRGLLFLASAFTTVALPRFAAARERPAEAYRWLRISVGFVAALVIVGLPALAVLRQPAVELAFGAEFAEAAGLIPLLAAGAGALALVHLLVYFHVALGTRAHFFVLAGVALEVVLVARFHETPTQIGLALLGSASLVAVLQLHAARSAVRWAPAGALGYEVVRAGRPTGHEAPELSVVLPCHNPGPGLREVVGGLRKHLAGASLEIVVVSDGSTDDTVRLASGLEGDGITVLHYDQRVGKGHALRVGLGVARGRYIAFMDSDGDIDPASLKPFVEVMKLWEPDIVLGSKRHPLSDVEYPPLRRLMSWGYHKLGRVLFRVNVRDTQTGLKLIRRETLEAVLPVMVEKRYAFDLELLVAARRLGFRRVFEAPITLDYQFSSNVNVGATLRVLVDTLAIFYRRFLLDAYRPPDGQEPRARARTRSRAARRAGDVGLRVLFVNWRDVRNPEAGGAEVWTHEVAKRWVAAGHDVWLLSSRFPGARRMESVDGVRIMRAGRLRTGTFHLRVQLKLARLRGFDVVVDEINGFGFLTPLWRRRLPVVVGLIHQLAADVWDAELPRPLAAIARRVEPSMLRLYRNVPMVAVSESTRSDLDALGLEDLSVVRGGIDAVPELGGIAKEHAPTFLFVGRLARNKRPDHAVEAFRAIRAERPDARLWIVGRGPMEAELRASLPEGAELLGHVSRAELYERMARAHALLVPSVREGWGLVVIEANAVGTPAVGYDVHGIRDSVRDGVTGRLVRAGSPDALAAGALALVANPLRYDETCDRARAWAGCFSWDRTAADFLAVLGERARWADADRAVALAPTPGG